MDAPWFCAIGEQKGGCPARGSHEPPATEPVHEVAKISLAMNSLFGRKEEFDCESVRFTVRLRVTISISL